jgi:pantetheine-phosphate adenylyltransferase
MKQTIGLYPGSFDPLTNGHLDIARRALKVCDRLTIAVVANPNKTCTFTAAERVALWKSVARQVGKNVKVDSFEGLLVDYARHIKADLIFRGLRAVADFEYEFQMALINRSLNPAVEICFLVPNEKFIFISSSAVKEAARLGGDVRGFVPPTVEKALRRKFGRKP